MKKILMSSLLALSLLTFTGCDNPISAMIIDRTEINNQDTSLDVEDTLSVSVGVATTIPSPSPEITVTVSPLPTPEVTVTPKPTATPKAKQNTPKPTPTPSTEASPVDEGSNDIKDTSTPSPTMKPTVTPVPWNTPTSSPTPSTQYQIDHLNFQYYDYSKEIGFTEVILEDKEHTAYSVNYPVIGIPTIDEDILSLIHDEINAFQQEYGDYISTSNKDKAILHIDYTSTLVGQHYASLAFHIEHYSSTLTSPTEQIVTRFFNLTSGKSSYLKNVINESYLLTLSDQVRNYMKDDPTYSAGIQKDIFAKNTAPTWKNFSKFTLTNDTITIYFDANGILDASLGPPIVTLDITDKSNFKIDLSMTADIPDNPLTTNEEETKDDKTEVKRVIDPTKPMIALTFDDGPKPDVTNRILDALDASSGKATFFVIGNLVSSHPEVLQRVVDSGNELGNHTYTHRNLTKITLKEASNEINKANKLIKKITGVQPTFIRPPYGSYNTQVVDNFKQKMVLWSVDTLDWKTRNKDMIIEEVLSHVKDGSIILMHDIHISTAEAAEYLIPELTKQGYQLVTLSELVEYRSDTISTVPVIHGKR